MDQNTDLPPFARRRQGAGPKPGGVPLEAAQDAMINAAREVMTIEDITRGGAETAIKLRGRLVMPASEAFARLRPAFEAVGYTPLLRNEDDQDVIRAFPEVYARAERKFPTTAVVLFVLTVLSVFLTGMLQADNLYLAPWDVILVRLTGNPHLVPFPELLPTDSQWREVIRIGALYSASVLGILGAHEMGHYLVARYYRVNTTPPFFIPMPLNLLGTMGAVIAMKEPAPNRRIQFDIGVAGPLAGLIIAVPVLFIGLSRSHVGTIDDYIDDLPPAFVEQNGQIGILHEGQSLAYLAAKYLMFGQVLPRGEVDVWVDPVAMAAWGGLLVTALNLIPVGQLDGGHIVYGLFGHKAKRLRLPILIVLIAFASIGTVRDLLVGMSPGALPIPPGVVQAIANVPLPGWSGWWIWVGLVYFLLRSHAPVLDEITGLDAKRKALGIAMLVIFILIFTPTPLEQSVREIARALAGFVL